MGMIRGALGQRVIRGALWQRVVRGAWGQRVIRGQGRYAQRPELNRKRGSAATI